MWGTGPAVARRPRRDRSSPDAAHAVPLPQRDAATALRFLREAFGFTISGRWDDPDGTVRHAEVTFDEGAVVTGTTRE